MANINIDLPGGMSIEVPQWATEDTLLLLVQALGATGKGSNNFNSALQKLIKKIGDSNSGGGGKTFSGSIEKATKSTQKLADEETKAAKAFQKAKEYLADMSEVAGSLVGGNGSFQMLDLAVEKTAKLASEAAGSFLESVPGVKAVATGLSEGAKIIAKFNNAVAQDTLEMLTALGKRGFGLGDNLQELTTRVLRTGLNLDAFTGIVTNNYAAILSMGRDFESGVKKFVNAQEVLTDTDGPFRSGMKMFGYSIEESSAFMGDFIEANRYALNLQNMTADELAKRTFDYAKNLNVIAEATGQEADAIRDRRLALMADGAFQAKMQQMTLEGKGAEAAAIQNFVATIEDPQLAAAAKEYFAFDGALVTKQSNMVALAIDGLLEAFQQQDIDALKKSQASLAENSSMLTVATFSLLEDAPAFANIVADLVAGSQKALSLLDGKTMAEYMADREQDLKEPVDKFGQSLVELGIELEALPNRIRANLIEPLEGFLRGQLNLLNVLLTGAGGPNASTKGIEGNSIADVYGTQEIPGVFSGGSVGNGLYIVGERGPELLQMDQGSSGYVYNNGQTKSLLNSGNIADMIQPRFLGGAIGDGSNMGSMFTELTNMANSFGELMNTEESQSLIGNMQSMVEGMSTDLKSGDTSKIISKMQEMSPSIESNVKNMTQSESFASLESNAQKMGNEMQKQSVDLLTKISQDNAEIKKLMQRVLPKAMSSNGYF